MLLSDRRSVSYFFAIFFSSYDYSLNVSLLTHTRTHTLTHTHTHTHTHTRLNVCMYVSTIKLKDRLKPPFLNRKGQYMLNSKEYSSKSVLIIVQHFFAERKTSLF